MNKVLRGSAASLAIGFALCAGAAFAQQPPSTAIPATTPEAAAPEAEAEIVVTGSRIARPDLEGTSPINVVTAQQIETRVGSANIENVLNDLPQFTPDQNANSNNPGGGAVTANLRGLGAQRTLVLVDGKRYMSFDVNQEVDLNTIPSSLIQRVDVVTGGQSAVYGSDAIAGVVNFVLKRNFEGAEINSSYTVTDRGDGQVFDVNGTIGANTSDGRGNVTLFAQYTKRRSTFATQRKFAVPPYFDAGGDEYILAGSGNIPQGRINIPGDPDAGFPGLGAASGLGCDNQAFNPDGSTKCYSAGTDSYNFNPINYLQIPQKRVLVYGQAHYDVNDHVKPYIEATFANNKVPQQLAATPINVSTPFGTGTIPGLNLQVNSPFFAPGVQAALAGIDATQSNGTDQIVGDGYAFVPSFGFRSVQAGPRKEVDERNAYRVVAGMKGDLAAGFTYDAYYMYARTVNSQKQSGNIQISHFLAATETAFDGAGNLVCRNGAAGCVPANIFGANNLSGAALNYITFNALNSEKYATQVASFVVTNPNLYDFGAGPIGIALGFEWRKEKGSVTPDSLLASGDVAGFNAGMPTVGGYNIKEYFGEIRVPLLRDQVVHRLELNGAVRYSQYSNAPGNVFTYAGGAELDPVEGLTLRAQYQRAVRGPSVNELYLGNTVSFGGNADPCGTADAATAGGIRDICLAQFAAVGAPAARIGVEGEGGVAASTVNPATNIRGNPNLKEETAKTYTLGAILRPKAIRGFSLTVDYYHINIDNYIISNLSPDTIADNCYNQGLAAYCSLIARNSSGEIVSFTSQALNSGGAKTRGIDVSAGYSLPLGEIRGQDAKVTFGFDGTRLLKLDLTPVVGLPTVYECAGSFGVNCGIPTPKWRHVLRTTLGAGPASVTMSWRYIGKAHDDDPTTDYVVEKVKAVNYFDLTTTFDVDEHMTFNIGVSNLTDKDPPIVASQQQGGNGQQSNTFPTFYDTLGRTFFVSAKAKF